MDMTPTRQRDSGLDALSVTRPLAGTAVRTLGDSLALRVAVARLRALGCVVEAGSGPPPTDAPAGWLGVTGVPFGPLGGALPECRIGWSGPVAVPMTNEREVQAACGLMQVHGRASGGPRALGVDYASVCAGVLAGQAVTAGVLAFLRGGTALTAATSVAQAALLALTQYVAVATVEPGTDTHARAGIGDRTPPFLSADGVRFEIETFDAGTWQRFWTALGADRTAIAAGWRPFQQRFATATCALPAALGAAAGALDYESLRTAAETSGVSILPVRTADAPGIPAPASPWRLDAPPSARSAAPALPPLGPGERAPLSGLRVIEATNRVQGPLAGHLLSLLGAEVIRLEPPGGDPMRGVPPMAGEFSARFLALNRGKAAVEADLKSAAGRRTALELAASAHVFLHNWPPGRAAAWGLDHGDLATVRPSLVYAYTGGWAEALPAPQPMGTDYLVQAYSGVAALVAGPGEPPAPSLVTLTDVLGALIGAEGAVAALLARARIGVGVRAATALIDAARLIRDASSEAAIATSAATATGADTAAGAGTGTAGGTAAAVTDLATMAADPAYAAALHTSGVATYSRAPWTFAPPASPDPREAIR